MGMFHGEMAKLLGVSRRSYSRWASEGTRLERRQVAVLADLAITRDEALASELAALVGETLVSLGLEEPAAPLAPSPVPSAEPLSTSSPKLIDVVVCAAAEALDVSPRAVRPALLAAVRCARELGLTLETMETILSAPRT